MTKIFLHNGSMSILIQISWNCVKLLGPLESKPNLNLF